MTSLRGTSRQLYRLPARSVLSIVGLLILALPSASHAQEDSPSGEELFVDRLGCWNCHGKTGGGGAGPAISEIQLPLRIFASYLRLPSGEMPQVSARLASDADVAILYRWLDGLEAVKTPSPITLSLEASPITGGGYTEVELTAQAAEQGLESDIPDAKSLRYRVTLLTMVPWVLEKTPIAHQTVDYQLAGREDWSAFTTDEHGEALLGSDQGFDPGDMREPEKITARLRTALTAGRHAFVVEAIDYTKPANPVVVGIGTVVLRVE